MDLIELVKEVIESAIAGELKAMFALAFILMGLAGVWSLIYQIRIDFWPTTESVLLKAGTRELGSDNLTAERWYMTDLRYEYVVDGVRYEGSELSPWKVMASYNMLVFLHKSMTPLGVGDAVPVIYNPRNPKKSFPEMIRHVW